MIALYIIAGVIALFLILSLIAPKEFEVYREIIVSKDPKTVYDSLKSLKEQNNWSVWGSRDPGMKNEYTGIDGEVGSVNHWIGNKEVGEGEQEITGLSPFSRVDTELRFLKPWKATNKGYFIIDEVDSGSKVRWGFSGKNKVPMNVMMMFMNMDKAVGKDFETGLSQFKKYIESK